MKANKMLQEAQEDAQFQAKLSIGEYLNNQKKKRDEEQNEESTGGFLSSFSQKLNKKADTESLKRENDFKNLEESAEAAELQAKLAPALANQALGEAIFSKSGVSPVSKSNL